MSVRKRIWTTPKGEERTAWQADYVDGQGKRRRKNFDTKKEADAFVKRAAVEVEDGTHVADGATVTIKQAGDLWMKSGASDGLERTSLDQRRQHLELHLVPIAGTVKLNKITVPWLRSFQDELREAGRSPAMVKRVTVSLGSILGDAQGRGLVIRNVVHELSRKRSTRKAEKRAKARLRVGEDIPTNDEVRAILNAAEGRYRPLLVTAIFTGLRASELRGLRWEDVDLDKATLHVRQRVDRYGEVGMPKSDAGQRSLPLPPMVTNTLREWRLKCPKGKGGYVFANEAGNADYHSNMMTRGLWPAQIAAGVSLPKGRLADDGTPLIAAKYPGWHALRHWYASWCINRKLEGGLELSAKAVQTRMGHSSIQVTFDTYGHLFPTTDESEEMAAAQASLMAVAAT